MVTGLGLRRDAQEVGGNGNPLMRSSTAEEARMNGNHGRPTGVGAEGGGSSHESLTVGAEKIRGGSTKFLEATACVAYLTCHGIG